MESEYILTKAEYETYVGELLKNTEDAKTYLNSLKEKHNLKGNVMWKYNGICNGICSQCHK